jgi:hypothetical protein
MNEPETKAGIRAEAVPMAERFELALEQLVGMCHDGGLHPHRMTGPLRFWLEWAKRSGI